MGPCLIETSVNPMVLIPVDLHQLQAFDQIVLHGSFSKAARHLEVSQPTISLRIRALEQMVGGALFLRQGSQLRLTELGHSSFYFWREKAKN